jgi:hypothetical protein
MDETSGRAGKTSAMTIGFKMVLMIAHSWVHKHSKVISQPWAGAKGNIAVAIKGADGRE